MKNKVIVYNLDLEFAKRLASSLNIKLKEKAVFIPFCDYKMMREFEKDNDISLILIVSENIIESTDYKCKNIVVLGENKKESIADFDNSDEIRNELENDKVIYLYKFQKVDNLKIKIENILNCIDYQKGQKVESNNTIIYVLYSPISNLIYKKYFYNMANIYSKKNSCIYIQLNEIALSQNHKNFSNLIYYYKGKELNKDEIISQLEKKNKLYIIPGPSFPEDLALLSPIDMENILKIIGNELKIEYMFVDLDSSYIRNQFILQSANQILIPQPQNELEKVIITKFKKYLKKNNSINYKNVKEIAEDAL